MDDAFGDGTRSSHQATSAIPRWWPRRVYYGWALVITLGVTATASYGILSYAFAVFITPMGDELGWSKTQITGAFSLAQLVAGVSAIAVGRWVDRRGTRGVMTVGSVAATMLLLAWSRVQSLTALYVIWASMGIVLAAVLYEPAFTTVATWFRRDRGRALTLLTFMGGFAAVIFVPVATALVAGVGWRAALVWLGTIYALLTIVPHALVLRHRPADLGLGPDGIPPASVATAVVAGIAPGDATPASGTRAAEYDGSSYDSTDSSTFDAVRSPAFRWLTIAFALSALCSMAVTVHLVPLLLERGHSAAFAGSAMGVLGLMALPGRLVFTPLGDHWPRAAVTASIFALQTLALVAMLVSRSPLAVWVFVAFFGAGFGAITPARAALMAERFGAANYGQITGVLASVLAVARAAAPVGASLLYAVGPLPGLASGYDTVLAALLLLTIGSAVALLAAA